VFSQFLECCKWVRMRFYRDNGLVVVLRNCALKREHWLQKMRFAGNNVSFHIVWKNVAYTISLSLAAYTCQDICVQQTHAAKRYCRDLKWTFENLLQCCYYATEANSRTMRSQLSQSAFAGKGGDLVNRKLITAWCHNSELNSCAVWVSYR